MKNSYPSSLPNNKSFGWSYLDGKALTDKPGLSETELQGKWLPAILVGIYMISLWPPPMLPIQNLRWYMAFGLAIFAFLLQKKPIDSRAATVYWVVAGLNFLGAVLSLLRATYFNTALWNTVALGINFLIILLLLPVLATRLARRFLLIVLIGTAILWTFEIQRILKLNMPQLYFTNEVVGWNKNTVGVILTLAATVLFYLAAFYPPSRILRTWQVLIVRVILGAGGLYFLYYLSVIYDRSSVLVAFVGVGAILILLFIRSANWWAGLLRVGIAASVITLSVTFFLPKILEVSPQWNRLSNYSSEGLSVIDTYDVRAVLIGKALYLVSKNPFLGVGIGGTFGKIFTPYGDYPSAFIHNVYLSEWAEKGILALLGYLVWFLAYLKMLRRRFFDLPLADQTWLLLSMLGFLSGFTADNNTILFFMIAILSGIYYEQNQMEQTKTVDISRGE